MIEIVVVALSNQKRMRPVVSPKEYDLIRDLSNGYGTAKHFVLVTPLTKNTSLSPALVTEHD